MTNTYQTILCQKYKLFTVRKNRQQTTVVSFDQNYPNARTCLAVAVLSVPSRAYRSICSRSFVFAAISPSQVPAQIQNTGVWEEPLGWQLFGANGGWATLNWQQQFDVIILRRKSGVYWGMQFSCHLCWFKRERGVGLVTIYWLAPPIDTIEYVRIYVS